MPYDVRNQGAVEAARHVGGWLTEDGRQQKDTDMAVRRGRGKIGHVAKAWRFQGEFGRGNRSGVRNTVRLTVMKAA
eukprot:6191066-Alexandrium_andersonii.AAC.1